MDTRDTTLVVDGVSKKYCRHLIRSFRYALYDIGRQVCGLDRRTERLGPHEFWSLKGVSFTLRRGESLGIVGPNGAGKTTLLKIIGGLIKQDGGRIKIRGKVIPLFARGAGFSKVLTGHENIRLNLMLLGLSAREIKPLIPSIIDFAELPESVLDAPLKGYSSGMSARLGFSCAVHAKADLLLVDEALAVGDMKFRAKCYRKLHEIQQTGASVIMVTHSVSAVINSTERAIYLHEGRVILEGATSVVASRYEEDQLITPYLSAGSPGDTSNQMEFLDADGNRIKAAQTGQGLRIKIRLPKDFLANSVAISFEEVPRFLGVVLEKKLSLPLLVGDCEIHFAQLGLVGGFYRVRAEICSSHGSKVSFSSGLRVISPAQMSQNVFFQPANWSAEPA